MYQTKEIVPEIRRAIKRRKKLLIITPIFFVILSFGALYFIEPKYESSTSILVQKEETLNPLMLYDIPENMASEDRLKSFNEIIYSRTTIEKLIDSLDFNNEVKSEIEKQALVDKLRDNIKTDSRASDSFEITYVDTDPVRARDGVALLANHFIQTRQRLETRKNNEAVEFFQNKINELEDIVDNQRDKIVSSTKESLKEVPIDQTALQTRLQSIDNQLDQLELEIIQEEKKLETLEDFLNQDSQTFSVQPLYKLPLNDIPFGNKLGDMLGEYDNLKEQFTDNYPPLRSLRTRILELSNRIPPAIESKLSNLKMQQKNLSSQRTAVIDDIERSFIASQRSNSQQTNIAIYQELYNDMKMKLEQARMTRDIGDKSSEQFVVLDPAYIPEKPSSPDKQIVIAVGFFIGLIFGGLFMGIAEIFDTTVRTEEDLELPKPIIAYLSDGRV